MLDAKKAKSIAVKFLGINPHYTNTTAAIDEGIWIVMVKTKTPNKTAKCIRIDSSTKEILDYS